MQYTGSLNFLILVPAPICYTVMVLLELHFKPQAHRGDRDLIGWIRLGSLYAIVNWAQPDGFDAKSLTDMG